MRPRCPVLHSVQVRPPTRRSTTSPTPSAHGLHRHRNPDRGRCRADGCVLVRRRSSSPGLTLGTSLRVDLDGDQDRLTPATSAVADVHRCRNARPGRHSAGRIDGDAGHGELDEPAGPVCADGLHRRAHGRQPGDHADHADSRRTDHVIRSQPVGSYTVTVTPNYLAARHPGTTGRTPCRCRWRRRALVFQEIDGDPSNGCPHPHAALRSLERAARRDQHRSVRRCCVPDGFPGFPFNLPTVS